MSAGHDQVRYLAAKRTVDDRAIDRRLWAALQHAVADLVDHGRPLRAFEVGAGIGSMVERLVDWDLLTAVDPGGRRLEVTAVDVDAAAVAAARRRLPAWARARGLAVAPSGGDDRIEAEAPGLALAVDLRVADVFDLAAGHHGPGWDLVLAHAVLDLLDVPAALRALLALARPGGLLYLTANFDGVTALEPPVEPALDARLEALFHASMDRPPPGTGRTTGDSRSGRHLLVELPAAGAAVLGAAASDWVVVAGPEGYPGDEAWFLRRIVDMVAAAAAASGEVDPARLDGWLARRHAQIEAGALVYVAHQLDVLARRPGPGPR